MRHCELYVKSIAHKVHCRCQFFSIKYGCSSYGDRVARRRPSPECFNGRASATLMPTALERWRGAWPQWPGSPLRLREDCGEFRRRARCVRHASPHHRLPSRAARMAGSDGAQPSDCERRSPDQDDVIEPHCVVTARQRRVRQNDYQAVDRNVGVRIRHGHEASEGLETSAAIETVSTSVLVQLRRRSSRIEVRCFVPLSRRPLRHAQLPLELCAVRCARVGLLEVV